MYTGNGLNAGQQWHLRISGVSSNLTLFRLNPVNQSRGYALLMPATLLSVLPFVQAKSSMLKEYCVQQTVSFNCSDCHSFSRAGLGGSEQG